MPLGTFFAYLITSYKDFWRRVNDFSGRTSRIEFWAAIFTNEAIVILLMCIVAFFNDDPEAKLRNSLLVQIYGLASAIPILAIRTRRLRDAGKSTFWAFLIALRFPATLFFAAPIQNYIRITLLILEAIPLWYFTRPSFDRKKQ